MKLIIEIPDKMYHKINAGLYDYGDLNIIIQNGISFNKIRAEIEQLHLIGYATIDGKREIAKRAVMQIIDKYETEGEDEK